MEIDPLLAGCNQTTTTTTRILDDLQKYESSMIAHLTVS
jgi:hypothetical protein